MDHVSCVQGTCMTMCPIEEFRLRQREGLLHRFELLSEKRKPVGRGRARLQGDIATAVKEFSRPAAGRADPTSSSLRPPAVLHETVSFLFQRILPQHHTSDEDWNLYYDFVFDRLRAVRQDMVIQGIKGQDAVTVLEACVRFHVYAAYRLCQHSMMTFDPVINSQHAQECLKRLLCLYSTSDLSGNEHKPHSDIHTLVEDTDMKLLSERFADTTIGSSSQSDRNDHAFLKEHNHNRQTKVDNYGQFVNDCGKHKSVKNHWKNQAVFEALYLLYNLGDSDALRHFLELPKSLRCECLPALAYKISISYLQGNIIRVLRLASRLNNVILLCSLHRHLDVLRLYGLKVFSTAYSSKNCRFPVSHLTQLLGFDSEEKTIEACEGSGLDVTSSSVCFVKNNFRQAEKVMSTKWEYLEEKLSSYKTEELLGGQGR